MLELLIIILVVTIGVVAVRNLLEGDNEPKQLLDNVGKKGSATLTQVNDQFRELRDRFSGKKQVNLAQNLRGWVTDQLGHEAGLQQWLLSLSDEAFEILSLQIATYCDEFNIDINWLIEKKLDRKPELKTKVQRVVVTYCSACWQAVQIQKELQSFKTVETILTNPEDKKHQALSQKLYVEFIKQGLIANPEADMYVAAEGERRKHIAAAIQEVAQKDQAKFDALFNQLMAQG